MIHVGLSNLEFHQSEWQVQGCGRLGGAFRVRNQHRTSAARDVRFRSCNLIPLRGVPNSSLFWIGQLAELETDRTPQNSWRSLRSFRRFISYLLVNSCILLEASAYIWVDTCICTSAANPYLYFSLP